MSAVRVSGPGRATLFGRAAEVARLDEFVDRVVRGGGGTMVVRGPAGVGKSRLLGEAADAARSRDSSVISASGVEFEAEIGFAVLQIIVAPHLEHRSELPAGHAEALGVALGLHDGPTPRPLVLGSAVHSLLTLAAARRPILIVVDDLPWVDPASAGILAFLSRRLDGTRIGILIAHRSEDGPGVELPDAEVLDVGPLDEHPARQLLAARRPDLPAHLRARILDDASGNPLALVELSRGASDEHRRWPAVLPRTRTLPQRLLALFADRIDALPADARRALLTAALDARTGLRELRSIGITADDLEAAQRVGLVTIDTVRMSVVFTHPLMRAAVVERAEPADRRAAHGDLARALAAYPDRQAWHLADAATGPDDRIADELAALAHRLLRRGDASSSVRALIRAAHLSESRAVESSRLAEAAYLGAHVTGEIGQATQLLTRAEEASPESATSLLAATAGALTGINADGDVDSLHRLLVAAIEHGDHDWSSGNDQLVEAISALVLLCWWSGRPEFWEPLHRALERFGDDLPELLDVQSKAFPDTVRTGAAVRDRLAALIDTQQSVYEPQKMIRLQTSAVYLDLLGGCRAAAWRIVEDGRAGGAVRSSIGGYMHLCLDDFVTGRWEEARALADEGLAVSRDRGYDYIAWYFVFNQALIESVRGEPAEAFRLADEVTAITAARNALGGERFGHQARTLAAIAQGDWEAAFRHASALSPAGEFRAYTPHAMWVAFDLVEAALRTGRRAEAEAHVRAMDDVGLEHVSPRMALIAHGARSLVAEPEEAAAAFERAVSVPSAERWIFDLAKVRLAYGDRLRRGGESRAARPQLHLAHDAFERLGARAWTERANESLRAAYDPEVRGTATGEALTAQERAVVELAAQGLSNHDISVRLFLSPRTVGGHLYRAFPKLGVTSRAGLRDVLDRLDQ
ncbi:AAA family ATPase [Agromyces seonyuensis]|uniref:AAA family ATPase n=1 Tax=Agromyces seonyuensis TaxID=2662446 RepID=UPI00136540DA